MNVANYIEKAKEIIGKWGYEEEYWWRTIAEALSEAHLEGYAQAIKDIQEGEKKFTVTYDQSSPK